ncbi:MAG: AtpZ/AtpI family protein [Gemmatimonadaceae bacterium]|nr:AtpZ/AtpI family protein [Gemmatimonadaceae bacterium]
MVDDPEGENRSGGASRDQSPWALAGLGMQFFLTLLLMVYAGTALDARFGTSPLCVLVGVLGGGGGSFVVSYRRLMRDVNRREAEQRARSAAESASRGSRPDAKGDG